MLLSILFHIGCSDYKIISKDVGDVFYQLEAGEVDVLLVVDNSCSMAPYQDKLSQNFETFLISSKEVLIINRSNNHHRI